MNKIKVLVLRTAGTNCDAETSLACELAGAIPERVHINQLIRKEKKLRDFLMLVIPGGFSYGDDVAAGKILANELRYKIFDQVEEFINSGKLVIGICNGFQVLVKTGLLPGLWYRTPHPFDFAQGMLNPLPQGARVNSDKFKQMVTLTNNDSGKFECRWVYLKVQSPKYPAENGVNSVQSPKSANSNRQTVNRGNEIWLNNLPPVFSLPIAHGEGKFVTDSKETLQQIVDNNQIAFTYVDEKGNPGCYPINPNGSVLDIAGITNPQGNVLGMMPHPERFLTWYHHFNRAGKEKRKKNSITAGGMIFLNAVSYLKRIF